ncbi:MAG: hypothetical protein ACO36A_02215 [Ilumatobacteraceae bacterium]
MTAIDILRWPGMNQAFIVSFVVTTAMCLAIREYGKRRPVGRPTTWGEAILGATYVYFVLFLAFGVVPHQFIDHADKELGWRKDSIVYGPFDVLKPKALGGNFPFTLSYEAVRDLVVLGIHGFYMVLLVWIGAWWQKRGATTGAKAIETSTYGRPLARKA